MPFSVPQEIGDLYDIGLETRDASNIQVKDRNGVLQGISKVAFVCSTKQEQEEATELQRKNQMIQLGPTLMDREWESWPGQTQGSWASGLGQRIQYGPSSDSAAYWDGLGLIWPVTDWLPQQPFQPPTYTDAAQPATGAPGYMGSVAGYLPSQGGEGYAVSFNAAGIPQVIFLNSVGRAFIVANPITGNAAIQDMLIAHGYIWMVGSDAANQLSLFYCKGPATTKLATASTATAVAAPAAMSGGRVINRQYIATVARLTPVASFSQDQITIWDVTGTGAAPIGNVFTVLNAPTGWTVEDTCFLGDDVIISMSDGGTSIIAAWNIASQSWRTLTQIPGASTISLVPIAGGLFLLARNVTSSSQRAIELFILQTNQLQDYGPLIPQIGATIYPYASAVSHPEAFGPYAVFAVAVQSISSGPVSVLIYAYDVLRGRIFKAATISNLSSSYAQALDRVPIAVYGSMGRISPVAFNTQWGFALNINTATAASPNVQEFDIGIQITPGSSGALLQLPFDGTSGQVDFTSAMPKLFKQILAKFSPLPSNVNTTVTLNIWLDQDPGSLSAVPDFTGIVAGGALTVGQTQLTVTINKMAVKVVYEIVTTGGVYSGGIWVNSPKITWVQVQASTGYVWHLFLSLARNTLCNNNNQEDYVFDRQKIDEVVAYNWLKQLWRLKSGQCKATFANGDSYNAQIQMMRGKGPKPFGVSMIASKPGDSYENIIEIAIREDV